MSKIYIVGSINYDFVSYVNHFLAEGETLTADSYSTYCGGKGANQASAIAKLGGKVSMYGCVGSDSYGQIMKDSLTSFGVDTSSIRATASSSGLAFITVAKGNNNIILHRGANADLSISDIDDFLSLGQRGDVLLLQQEVPLDINRHALTTAKARGMITVVNPAPAQALDCEIMSMIDVIIPNETETEILTGVNPIDDTHTALAIKQFYTLGAKTVIITLGARGAIITEGHTIHPIPAKKVKVVDTTSAGDTFIGAFCTYLASGHSMLDSAKFGVAAASITITRKGASISIPTLDEVLNKYYK